MNSFLPQSTESLYEIYQALCGNDEELFVEEWRHEWNAENDVSLRNRKQVELILIECSHECVHSDRNEQLVLFLSIRSMPKDKGVIYNEMVLIQ